MAKKTELEKDQDVKMIEKRNLRRIWMLRGPIRSALSAVTMYLAPHEGTVLHGTHVPRKRGMNQCPTCVAVAGYG
jgi:hypothetical protein